MISFLQPTIQHFGDCSWPVFTDDKNLRFDRKVDKYLECRCAVIVCSSHGDDVMYLQEVFIHFTDIIKKSPRVLQV